MTNPTIVPINPEDPNAVLSPLADPVVSAIFADANSAGLAIESLINATLKEDDSKLEGKILKVTPQRSHVDSVYRGCRVDVEAESTANERAILETQLSQDTGIMVRDLFSTSRIFSEMPKGISIPILVNTLPSVICINLLNYNIRDDNTDIVQPVKVMYTKEPVKVAVPNFSVYNVQLPRLLEAEADFGNALYCWGYTLYTAHTQEMTVQEVLAMTPELQAYAERDSGFKQFCQQYDHATADPVTRKEYYRWQLDLMREEGVKEAAMLQGRNEGLIEGRNEALMETARRLLGIDTAVDVVLVATGLDEAIVLRLKAELKG